jgi:OOP family OmpA-OmpF porin
MNKTLITLLVSGLLAANAQAAGQDNTWYGGAKLGWSNFYGVDESNAIAITDKDDDEVGAGAFAGYQINQNLGVELGYDYSLASSSTAAPAMARPSMTPCKPSWPSSR